jgi:hypothetical protein
MEPEKRLLRSLHDAGFDLYPPRGNRGVGKKIGVQGCEKTPLFLTCNPHLTKENCQKAVMVSVAILSQHLPMLVGDLLAIVSAFAEPKPRSTLCVFLVQVLPARTKMESPSTAQTKSIL